MPVHAHGVLHSPLERDNIEVTQALHLPVFPSFQYRERLPAYAGKEVMVFGGLKGSCCAYEFRNLYRKNSSLSHPLPQNVSSRICSSRAENRREKGDIEEGQFICGQDGDLHGRAFFNQISIHGRPDGRLDGEQTACNRRPLLPVDRIDPCCMWVAYQVPS